MSNDRPAFCDSCRAPILFVVVSNNQGRRPSRMPVNPDPDPAGNVAVLRDATGRLIGRVLVKDQRPVSPEVAYMPHFATCTNPAAHRRRRRGQWTADHSAHARDRRSGGKRRPASSGGDSLPGMSAGRFTITEIRRDHAPSGAGVYARVTYNEGRNAGGTLLLSRLDGETSWVANGLFGPNGYPFWCHGFGSRCTRLRVVSDETLIALLDQAAAALPPSPWAVTS